ncbi:MAG TPA: alpha-glucuronidase family glycosyl hydrolase [Cyclobacteriaceae bacterium]
MKKTLLLTFLIIALNSWNAVKAEDGYRLWLRYDLVSDPIKLTQYRDCVRNYLVAGNSPTLSAAREELHLGLSGLLGSGIPETHTIDHDGVLVAGKPTDALLANLNLADKLKDAGREGYVIFSTTLNKRKSIVIAANDDSGVLYGVFHFLKLLQTHQDLTGLSVSSVPKIKIRILNHWDNLDRTVERGYAGFSLWDWHKLPDYIDPRYRDYARANASLGINGSVVTNVNANALVLTPAYLEKVAALAGVFRPYGIRIYLTARFNAPMELDGFSTADPLDPEVAKWWTAKVNEIYKYIPDFGGFVVKANSEGQPGPQNYNRTHADGANMLAAALEPHHGIVMWRAFVYDDKVPDDRHKQAYTEFKPYDGTLKENVLIQVKNGAIDFQPREPFHPLFGAMPKTPLMMEFQITQEYLGFASHFVYLATLFKECLDSDTHAKGPGSTVARVIDGSLDNHTLSGMAGVANIGNDRNWCGHPFAQANWYSFGRLAWNHELAAEEIADEWIRMTFTNEKGTVEQIKSMMMASREITVNYMTPLGLHHIMGRGHHYGPGPWVKGGRPDWTSVYYHRADSVGIGFDRTASGSNAAGQYFPPVEKMFGSLEQCPEKYLLWFHHVPWDYKLKSGKTLWNALCDTYYSGVDSVRWLQRTWNKLEGKIDPERFNHVKMLLTIQEKEAVLWRNSCVLYFQTFSHRPIPEGLEKPEHPLAYYEKLAFPYAPGIRPRW